MNLRHCLSFCFCFGLTLFSSSVRIINGRLAGHLPPLLLYDMTRFSSVKQGLGPLSSFIPQSPSCSSQTHGSQGPRCKRLWRAATAQPEIASLDIERAIVTNGLDGGQGGVAEAEGHDAARRRRYRRGSMAICDGYFLGQCLAGVDLKETRAVEEALQRYESKRMQHTTGAGRGGVQAGSDVPSHALASEAYEGSCS
jgi:hypothetical protein